MCRLLFCVSWPNCMRRKTTTKNSKSKNEGVTAFEVDVLESIRQARGGEGRVTKVAVSAATEARIKVGLSQAAFAKLLGVSVRTLQEWEQGRREPSGAARNLLLIALRTPHAIVDAGEFFLVRHLPKIQS